MTRSGGPARRSGDRRKLVVVLVAGAAFVAVGLFALGLNGGELDEEARSHAAAACDLISKADEAAQAHTPARYAAAALLLDKAMIESARAAEADPESSDLDRAAQAMHLAAHRGDRGQWRDALGTALSTCHETFG